MKHISLQDFLGLTMAQKVQYFNTVVGVQAQSKWEISLLEALKAKNPRLIANFGGLMPFYNAVKDVFGELPQQPAPEQEVYEWAADALKAVGISPQIAGRFKDVKAVDLLKMSLEDLEAIKGVGKKTAEKIFSLLPKQNG